jgi:DNA-binding transcriptional ArsR family regulator
MTGPVRPGLNPGDESFAETDSSALNLASDLLRALGTPHRLAIVLELANGPRCVHELVDRLGTSQSLTSQHLRVLRNTGLAIATRRGKETAYALADEHVAHIARDALAHGGESTAWRRASAGAETPTNPNEPH